LGGLAGVGFYWYCSRPSGEPLPPAPESEVALEPEALEVAPEVAPEVALEPEVAFDGLEFGDPFLKIYDEIIVFLTLVILSFTFLASVWIGTYLHEFLAGYGLVPKGGANRGRFLRVISTGAVFFSIFAGVIFWLLH
jgi:hypothetical protein